MKEELDNLRPLPMETVQSIKEDFLLRNTYHSNAIEGNTLTLYETKFVLEEGVTVAGKSLTEHLEVMNHKEASLYMEEQLTEQLSERVIKNIHALVLSRIDKSSAGVYRSQEVRISGASHEVTSSFQITNEMNLLMKWNQKNKELHPVERASILHSKFVNIHPFLDGNGRTARLLMNFELMSSGYLPVLFKVEDRVRYYEVLDVAGSSGNYEPFIKMVAELEEESLNQYLTLLRKTN
ncbi:Fic family protein [Alkalicoccobacillus porphyridii]|uniref:Fic family protein n=1 Tax=Alkalicoccobacillus porphyridii TaxID=2597270 RepID=A0A554A2Q0_9BACI|nr:Fic family protein [Alkalicoccobacillus porphyridii]TSB47960.1 Fic family protein [Alkalicoccobacillus porphyridii]